MIHTTDTEWTFWEYLFTTKPGIGWIHPGLGYITGDVLIVVLTIIVICSLSAVRASGYFQVRCILDITIASDFLPQYTDALHCKNICKTRGVALSYSTLSKKSDRKQNTSLKPRLLHKFSPRFSCFFQVFYWSHFLYWVFLVFLVLHGTIFWCFFLVPGLLFTAEKLFSIIMFFKQMGSSKCYIEEVNLLPSKVCMIQYLWYNDEKRINIFTQLLTLFAVSKDAMPFSGNRCPKHN